MTYRILVEFYVPADDEFEAKQDLRGSLVGFPYYSEVKGIEGGPVKTDPRPLTDEEIQSVWTTSLDGFSDDDAGDSGGPGFYTRVGERIVWEDSNGFRYGVAYPTEEQAQERFKEILFEMNGWEEAVFDD